MKIKGIVYLIPGIVVLVLQLFYWSYAYGAFFPKGYEGESFQYFLQPKILKVLFEPNNGWFPYATTVFIGIIGALVVLRKDLFAKRILLLTLLIVSIYTYITASWWTYTFGCGLGARNFVDFSFLWIFLIALVLHSFEERKSIYYSWLGINLVFVIVNVLITYHYDNCWFGEENWDWNFYLELI